MKDLIQFQLTNGILVTFQFQKFHQRLLFVQGIKGDKLDGNATISLKGLKEGEFELLETSENYFDVLKKIYPNFEIQTETPSESEN